MPVEIKLIRFNEARLRKIRSELDYVTTEAFFKTIPLAEFSRQLLTYVQSVSPPPFVFTAIGPRTLKHRQTAAQMIENFREGWRVERTYEGGQINFTLRNIMENYSQQGLWFRLIEHGSTASTWVARRTFTFMSDFGWITFKRGQTIRHAPTKGAGALKKASDYIEENLVPEIKQTISSIIERRINAL